MCTRNVTAPPISPFAAGVSCAESCIENVKAKDRYAECLEVSVNFAFARDAAIIIPVILYARLLMRVASRRKVRPVSRLTLGKNHVSALQHRKLRITDVVNFFQSRQHIKLAEVRLKKVTSISKSEKARTMGTLKLHRGIIAEVYEPLRLYPIIFILILIADIAIYANVCRRRCDRLVKLLTGLYTHTLTRPPTFNTLASSFS